jgi:hypothetical protein
MREAVPELMESEAGLLYKMVTMLPPTVARKAGVRVCKLLQQVCANWAHARSCV